MQPAFVYFFRHALPYSINFAIEVAWIVNQVMIKIRYVPYRQEMAVQKVTMLALIFEV